MTSISTLLEEVGHIDIKEEKKTKYERVIDVIRDSCDTDTQSHLLYFIDTVLPFLVYSI